jgi:ankyrin repeat protein
VPPLSPTGLDYQEVEAALAAGDLPALRRLAEGHADFPDGRDPLVHHPWLQAAIGCSTLEVVQWMLEAGVDVNYEAADGYPALHTALDRQDALRHPLVTLLCEAGADVNAHGVNDWTPLHLAAARDDPTAIRILLGYGADPERRTRIDDYATPLEEARRMGRPAAEAALAGPAPR